VELQRERLEINFKDFDIDGNGCFDSAKFRILCGHSQVQQWVSIPPLGNILENALFLG
jgi:hypothetical protein